MMSSDSPGSITGLRPLLMFSTFVGPMIDAKDVVASRSKARGRHGADVSKSVNVYSHNWALLSVYRNEGRKPCS